VNRKTIIVLVGLVLAFAVGFGLAARMISGGGEVIARDVVAGGGGRGTAASGHVLEGTIGQTATGIGTAGNGTILVGGFQTMTPKSPSAARNWNLY
jgi:hypothetical protein